MTTHTKEEPVFQGGLRGWSQPEGYKFPRCKNCDHNFFDSKPIYVGDDPNANLRGPCGYCVAEMES